MSMYLNFEPHSWYKHFAIKFDENYNDVCEWSTGGVVKHCFIHGKGATHYQTYCSGYAPKWSAFTDDGNTYRIVELQANTLKELKQLITEYWSK
jgi:hypothetical protein